MDNAAPAAAPRYAIYFAPDPGSPWWQFGTGWLGRDEVADRVLAQRAPPQGITPQEWQQITAEPRRYGYHATLKAPFRLAAHTGVAELHERVSQLARELHAVYLGELQAQWFGGFVALTPTLPTPALTELATRCVVTLDDLRAPLLEHEVARRRPEHLDPRGRELLQRYGYPHVIERFQFHMTLAMCADEALAARVVQAAQRAVEPLNREHRPLLERLCVFEQARPGAAFRRLRDFELRP